jgi:hypothetical protein
MKIKTKIRYECDCGWVWVREVWARVAVNMDRPIAATCPGCVEIMDGAVDDDKDEDGLFLEAGEAAREEFFKRHA